MTTRSDASTACPPRPESGRTRRAAGVHVQRLGAVPRTSRGTVDALAVAAALGDADLFENAEPSADLRADPGTGWSYVVPRLGPRLVDDGRHVGWHLPDGRWIGAGTDPFSVLERWTAAHGIGPHDPRPGDAPPFTGGLVGAFAYELAHRVEPRTPRARDDRGAPWLSLRVAPVLVAVPPSGSEALAVGRPLATPGWELDEAATAAALADVTARLRAAQPPAGAPAGAPRRRRPVAVPVRSSMSRKAYLAAVDAALETIATGDAFQVNLAHRLTARTAGSTHQLYAALRTASPAPHGAALADTGIASVSPETFLWVDGAEVTIRPIKGTRARSPDPRIDAAQADDLLTSAKDRAENVMVVDLERNDLGRVCQVGSVRVPELCRLEGHPTVWHLTSEVRGTLRDGLGYGELLRATFPCGSITGAPKIAAIGAIDRLEPVTRGWYCGAVGVLGAGHASLSVAIRTAVRHPDGTVDHAVGAGIVAASDPAAEHAETLAKAAAFLRAVEGRPTTEVTGRSPRSRRASRAAG